MSNIISLDIDKLKAMLPEIILRCSATINEAPIILTPDTPVVVTPDDNITETSLLTDFLWENSDQLVPGKAIFMPNKNFTGKTLNVYVNNEALTYHSTWRDGREIWYASKGIESYPKAVLRLNTDTTTYEADPIGTTLKPNTDIPSETLRYHGRYNGDRPTWYGGKNMSQYPSTMRVVIDGCLDKTIVHDGKRYDDGSLIVKQSDVYGRGVAVVYSASCKSQTARFIF